MADTTSVLYKIGQAVKNTVPEGTLTNNNFSANKLGYGENGKNYPVKSSNGKLFVNVPWVDTDTNTTYMGLHSKVF